MRHASTLHPASTRSTVRHSELPTSTQSTVLRCILSPHMRHIKVSPLLPLERCLTSGHPTLFTRSSLRFGSWVVGGHPAHAAPSDRKSIPVLGTIFCPSSHLDFLCPNFGILSLNYSTPQTCITINESAPMNTIVYVRSLADLPNFPNAEPSSAVSLSCDCISRTSTSYHFKIVKERALEFLIITQEVSLLLSLLISTHISQRGAFMTLAMETWYPSPNQISTLTFCKKYLQVHSHSPE